MRSRLSARPRHRLAALGLAVTAATVLLCLSVVSANAAPLHGFNQRGDVLIAGTGAPAATTGYPPAGAVDSRVLLVNRAGKIVWAYGKAGVSGTGANRLDTPVQATWLPNHDVLITDQANQRVIMVTPKKKIVWQYGQTGVAGSGPDQLNTPNSAELLKNGHILIADEGGNRVIEVSKDKT